MDKVVCEPGPIRCFRRPPGAKPEGAPTILTVELPTGAIGVPYKVNGNPVVLSTSGGTGTYTWSISSGSLPPGLSLNAQSAVISGTPTGPYGFSIFTVKVTDSAGMSGTQTLHIYIEGVVIVSSTCGTGQVANQCPSGSVGVPYMQTLTASGGQAPYQWALASASNPLPAGLALDPATCTNSTGTCIISGVPTMNAAPTTFTLQVTDSETSPGVPAVGLAPFTITIMSITTTSLPSGDVYVPYNATVMVAGGGGPPGKKTLYTWATSNLPPGLRLDEGTCDASSGTTCTIKGTPSKADVYAVAMQVTDNEMPNPAVATATLTIDIGQVVLGNSNLSGTYVFNFSGYNSGKLVLMAGSFVADGKGKIASGVLDYNDGSGEPVDMSGRPIPQKFVSGSKYSINPDGSGTMTIVTDQRATFKFTIAIRADNSGGSLIQSDSGNPQAYGSGMMMSHVPLAQGQTWPLCGNNISLGLFGFDSSVMARYAAAGEFLFNPTTCVDVENGILDINDGGVTSSNTTFTGAFNQYDVVTSRGTAGFIYKGNQNQRYFNPFYLISSSDHKKNKLIMLTENVCDMKLKCTPTNPTLWSLLPQTSSARFGANNWNNLALAGTAVAELNALDTNGAPDVTAGLFIGSGMQGNSCQSGKYDNATFAFDENQGGTCNGGTCSRPQSSRGMYCIDKSTGRVTLSSFSGPLGQYPPVLYMVGANQAFVVGTDPAVTSGSVEQQTASLFSESSIAGLYPGGTITPVTMSVTNGVSVLIADGDGNMNGTENISGPSGPSQQPFTYTYSVDTTGRVIVRQNGNTLGIAYVVSATKFVLLSATDPNPALSIFGQ